ncbi:MAG: ABC transporter ATP-binding protein [Gemmatimonadaceae bacterium]|jgi:iron complex transport system ATP-binding protein|nr:ABC transporter ATP-binding protein [Gemmatimonadaceae bacterium]
MSWRTAGLTVRHGARGPDVLHDVALTVQRGALTALLGPNGAGKSTLLRAMVGVQRPRSGGVLFEERALDAWSRRDLAQAIGVVPQEEETAFPITVQDYVAMGRYPHLGAFGREGVADRAAIDEALVRADLTMFRTRLVQTLSGGERQRARVARALAQQPRAFALDEPTAALDVPHEMAIFELMRAEVDAGRTVVLVTHHLNLAARYADTVVLLRDGHVHAVGTPRDVLTASQVEAVFGWPVAIVPHVGPGPDTGAPQVVPLAPARASSLAPRLT